MHSVVYDHQAFTLQRYGGVSRYVCELSSRVHRAPGFSARVVAPIHFNSYLPDCDVPQTSMYVRKIWKTGPLYRALSNVLSPGFIRANPPSLIHQTYFAPLRKPVNVPVVVTVFDMIHELFPAGFSTRDRSGSNKRNSVERADHVLCISESTANDLMRLYSVSRAKISVTHLGYSEIFNATMPTDETAPLGRPYLLYVGQRAGYKNFDKALSAYASSRRLRSEFDFVAFGGPPFDADELAQIARLQLDAGSVVRLTGSDSDLARAYRHARALVYPSLYEGFGIPPLEAMAAGCAVVCSNASSIPEVVGSAAVLFEPNDIDAIRQALENVCLADSTWARSVAAGKERIRNFSWDRCAGDTLAAYRRVVGETLKTT